MSFTSVMGKYFWLLCIIAVFINAASWRRKSKKFIVEKPELEKGYAELIQGFIIWCSIPLLVMGVGCVFGGVSLFDYFNRIRDGNPYVVAFFATVIIEWIGPSPQKQYNP